MTLLEGYFINKAQQTAWTHPGLERRFSQSEGK
jgi:hypothetical protein